MELDSCKSYKKKFDQLNVKRGTSARVPLVRAFRPTVVAGQHLWLCVRRSCGYLVHHQHAEGQEGLRGMDGLKEVLADEGVSFCGGTVRPSRPSSHAPNLTLTHIPLPPVHPTSTPQTTCSRPSRSVCSHPTPPSSAASTCSCTARSCQRPSSTSCTTQAASSSQQTRT